MWYHGADHNGLSIPALQSTQSNLSGRPLFSCPDSAYVDKARVRSGEVVGADQLCKQFDLRKTCFQFLGFGNGTSRLTDQMGYPKSTISVMARGAAPVYNLYITENGQDLLPGKWLWVVFVQGDRAKKDNTGTIVKMSDQQEWYGLGDQDYLENLLAEENWDGNVVVQQYPVGRVLTRTKGLTVDMFKKKRGVEDYEKGVGFTTVHTLITV